MPPHRKCKFQPDWLKEDEQDDNGDKLMHYVTPDKDDIYRAMCTVCAKSVNVACMGKAALLQHARGDIHKEKMKIKKGTSKQTQLPFQKKGASNISDTASPAAENASDEEIEVVHETGEKPKRPDFTISVAKYPANLTEPFSQQVRKGNIMHSKYHPVCT